MKSSWVESIGGTQPSNETCLRGYDERTRRCRRRSKRPALPRAPILTLFNTGQGLNVGDTDIHYLETYHNPYLNVVPRAAVVFFDETWTENDTESAWIGFNSSFGVHIFETSFDLTGFNSSTASLSLEFQVAGADELEGIWLNTDPFLEPEENLLSSDIIGPDVWHPFTITSGFVSGINILHLNLRTIALTGPTGIRMRVVSATAVPTT